MVQRLNLKRKQAEVRRKWHLPKDAEVEFHEVEKSKPCKHYFIQRTAQWIECKCGWGLQMSVGDTLTNGHLYSNGKKVV